jgi:hypothetical protein
MMPCQHYQTAATYQYTIIHIPPIHPSNKWYDTPHHDDVCGVDCRSSKDRGMHKVSRQDERANSTFTKFPAKTRVRIQLLQSFPPRREAEFNSPKKSATRKRQDDHGSRTTIRTNNDGDGVQNNRRRRFILILLCSGDYYMYSTILRIGCTSTTTSSLQRIP